MILETLRQQTAPLHEEIEAVMDWFNPHLQAADYIAYLERFYGFYLPLEEQIEDHAHSLNLDWPQRTKTPWLRQDLTELGHTSSTLASLPRFTKGLKLPSKAHVMGYLYVAEGSTLGGQMLLRHLRKILPGCQAFRFFIGHGDQTGFLWRRFLTLLEAFEDESEAVVQAAQDTFRTLTEWVRESR